MSRSVPPDQDPNRLTSNHLPTLPPPIITIENLGKSYLVGHQSVAQESYTTFRDVIGRNVRSCVRMALEMTRGQQIVQGDEIEEFWALRNVSLEVRPGEIVGIVGGNGAGKSTLLKILSRITEPSEGRVRLGGRVASLLEVGTGFHAELTGRENIYLNGAILGMTRSEIKRKFSEIVEFAEVDRFLDTPVKRYSSGMYVRLAFAVAAHLDPEILVIDEVLAVGDVQFQRKCLGKIQDVSRQQGRTVLFVSHNMAAVKSLCTRAICLHGGRLVADDLPGPVLQKYYHSDETQEFDGNIPCSRPRSMGTGEVRLTQVQMLDEHDGPIRITQTRCALKFVLRFSVLKPVGPFFLELGLTDSEGQQITQSRFPEYTEPGLVLGIGDYEIRVRLKMILFPGSYGILVAAHQVSGSTIDWVDRCLDFEVLNAPPDRSEHHPWPPRGHFRPDEQWSGVAVVRNGFAEVSP